MEHQSNNVRVRAKSILCGEHAVVYGCPAIGMPIFDLGMDIRYEPRAEKTQKITIDHKPASPLIRSLIEETFDLLSLTPMNFEIDGHSTIPPGAGFGSSAAFCVSISRLIANAHGIHLTSEKLQSLSNQLEKRFHGDPSGIDTSVIASESLIYFNREEGFQKMNSHGGFHFLLIDSGIRSPTISMVQLAKPYFVGPQSLSIKKQFTRCVEGVKEALESSNTTQLAFHLTENSHLLTQLGVVTPPLQNIISTCLDRGCLAAKITGSGGGGCVLALLPKDTEKREIVTATLSREYADHFTVVTSL